MFGFCWHNWSKWEEVQYINLYTKESKDIPIKKELIQSRHCINCNKIIYRTSKVF